MKDERHATAINKNIRIKTTNRLVRLRAIYITTPVTLSVTLAEDTTLDLTLTLTLTLTPSLS